MAGRPRHSPPALGAQTGAGTFRNLLKLPGAERALGLAATPPGGPDHPEGSSRRGVGGEKRAHGLDRTAAHAHTGAHICPPPRRRPKAWKVPAGSRTVRSRHSAQRQDERGREASVARFRPSPRHFSSAPVRDLGWDTERFGSPWGAGLSRGRSRLKGGRGMMRGGRGAPKGRGGPSAQLPEPLSPGSRGRNVLSPPRSLPAQQLFSFPAVPASSPSREPARSGAARRAFWHAPLRAGFNPESHAAGK